MSLNIKRAIAAHSLTSKKIAEDLGMSPVSFSYMINGNPTVDTLEKIAKSIGCDITDLFDKPEQIICPHCGKPITVKIEK